MIRIFHTSDVHIGLKFTRGYSDSLRQKLVDARIETLARMVATANEEQCDLLIVAGDLFEGLQVPKAKIRATGDVLKRFQGLAVVLPGNHDYIQESDDPIWPTLVDSLGERHLVLRACRPYDLSDHNVNAVLYPGVCTSRHSSVNSIDWVADALRDDATSGKLRIGVAHGSLKGLSPDFEQDYYPMDLSQLHATGVHLWLLGHTHIRYPDKEQGTGDTVFFPSVPEPDGFDCRHSGYAWIIDLGEDGTTSYRSVSTGHYRFHEKTAFLANEADIEQLKRHFETLNADRDLVKLRITGRLKGDLFDTLPTLITSLESQVLYLEPDHSAVVREIRLAEIDREFTQGSFPHRFLSELAESEDDSLALQLAYEMIQEAKS